ncbi:MAG: squalene synthase HpnC [Magnetococcales bacterium]|nr:squalene synthase HpnC [Magnetococcales bacterium]
MAPSWRPLPSRLREDFRYCREIARQHGENFPVASLLAPWRIRPYLFAIYAFARTADDFADLPGREENERLMLLDDWSRRLQGAEAGRGDHPIFRALAHVMAETGLPAAPLHHLLTAFRMDVTEKRYDTHAQLEEYCRYSANPVGRIVLHLAGEAHAAGDGRRDPKLAWSDDLCTALQLVNHWQDLGLDAAHGRPLYLPREVMERFGVTEEMIVQRRFSAGVAEMMMSLVEGTRDYFQRGEPLLTAVGRPLRLELGLTWEAGMELLRMIEAQGGDTLRRRPRLSRPQWLGALWRAGSRAVS